ncbi:hypothetical protein PM136_09460 [Escherichia coli]|nr:hypothetical protein [Escherichia coli]MDB7146311.1 hypothetical protein [Escherichia coli]
MAAGGCGGCCFPVAEKENARLLAGYQLSGEIFKYLTIQAVDCCLVCGEFVKRNWHGESPCAEGRLVNGMISLMIVSENTRV